MPQSVGIASSSVNAVETTESRDYSILVFRDYRLEIQATTAGVAGGLRHGERRDTHLMHLDKGHQQGPLRLNQKRSTMLHNYIGGMSA